MGTARTDLLRTRTEGGHRNANGEDKAFVGTEAAGKGAGVFHEAVGIADRGLLVEKIGKGHLQAHAFRLQPFFQSGENG